MGVEGLSMQWSEPRASRPARLAKSGVRGGWLAVAHFYRSPEKLGSGALD